MKSLLTVILVISLLGLSQVASTDQSVAQLDILAKRGKGVVSQDKFDARAARIPDTHRLEVLRDRNRLRDILNSLLLNSQLAADAREAGLEADKLVIERMKLAAETELAAAWLQHYVASQPAADYEALALDYYRLHKGEMLSMEGKGERMICKFQIPSRGIIGMRNQLLTATAGEAIMTHRFLEYQPLKGGIPQRQNGSLVSMENGSAIPYSIDKLQDRGRFFVNPNEDIYEGQVIGESTRQDDMTVNITKTKKMSNVRSSGADDKAKIVPAIKFSLEEALEYIQKDEYVEVTPKHLRLRKIYLKETDRKRNKF